MAATVRIAILANANKAKVTIDKTRKSLTGLGRAAKGVSKLVAPLASVASLTGPAVAGVLALVKAVAAVGKAAATAAPLLAFAPSLIGGYVLLRTTLATVGKAMGKALAPVSDAFKRTQGSVAALAQQGLPALGRAFVKVNMPAIDSSMRRIARSANANVREFGRWVNTGPGVKLIRDTTNGVAAAFERAAPHITTAVMALGNMANRAGVAGRLENLGGIVGRLADRFTRWADSISAADINKALASLRGAAEGAREKLAALREIVEWMAANQAKVKAFSNAMAGIGLVLGALTGNWVAVAVAGLALVVNNFGFVKTAFTDLRDFWSRTWESIATNPSFVALKQAVSGLFAAIKNEARPVWESLKNDLGPAFTEVKTVIKDDLLPALTGFTKAITPIVSYCVRVFGPAVAATFLGAVRVVSAALRVISGVLNIFSAVFSGNWRRLWTGVRQIVAGAWAAVRAAFSVGKASVLAALRGLRDGIKGLFRNALGLLVGAGRDIIDGFVSGLRGGFQKVKNTLGNLTSLLPDWKGPASRDRTLLVKNGKLVIGGFIAGLRSKYGDVRKSLRDFTRGLANQKDAKVVGDALQRGIQALKAKIDAQKKVVADLVKARSDYAKTIAGGLRSGGLTSIDLIYQDPSFQKNALVDGLKSRLQAIRDFQANLRALTKKGLSKGLIRQIADSGLETGSQYLTALQGASPALIREINRLNRAINSVSSATGSMVANDRYGARIASERRKLPPQEMILKLGGESSRSGAGALIAALLEEESRKSGGLRIKLRPA